MTATSKYAKTLTPRGTLGLRFAWAFDILNKILLDNFRINSLFQNVVALNVLDPREAATLVSNQIRYCGLTIKNSQQ